MMKPFTIKLETGTVTLDVSTRADSVALAEHHIGIGDLVPTVPSGFTHPQLPPSLYRGHRASLVTMDIPVSPNCRSAMRLLDEENQGTPIPPRYQATFVPQAVPGMSQIAKDVLEEEEQQRAAEGPKEVKPFEVDLVELRVDASPQSTPDQTRVLFNASPTYPEETVISGPLVIKRYLRSRLPPSLDITTMVGLLDVEVTIIDGSRTFRFGTVPRLTTEETLERLIADFLSRWNPTTGYLAAP